MNTPTISGRLIYMRTDAEIIARLSTLDDIDPLGFSRHDLLCRLSFDAAKPHLKDDATETQWTEQTRPRDRAAVLDDMRDYVTFGWEKIQDHRGLSANRTVAHYRAWIWLLGDDDYNAIAWVNYPPYGAPILKQICDRYGFDYPKNDAMTNMIEGRSCTDACESCAS